MTDEMKVAVTGLQWLCTFGLALYTYITNRSAARTAEVQDISDRVLVLEEKYEHLPTQNLVQKLDGDMKAISAELRGLRSEIAPLAKSVDRINDYLLNNK